MLRALLFGCLLCLTLPFGASASWQQFAQGIPISAIDFFDSHRGLAITAPGGIASGIQLVNDSTFTGVFVGTPGQILIQDENRAWALDQYNQAVYLGTNHWTSWKQVAITPFRAALIAATPSALFFITDSALFYTVNGDTAIQATGIYPGDDIYAIDYISPTKLIAVSHIFIYTSNDGGASWTRSNVVMSKCESVFVDREHGWAYAGGDQLRKSTDNGATWTVITPAPQLGLANLGGQVFGVHDCTGTVFVNANGIFRSRDGGISFENIGSYDPIHGSPAKKVWAFNRGSTIYWWNSEGFFATAVSVSFDGVDGVVRDSVSSFLSIAADTIADTACMAPRTIGVSVFSSTCSPIRIDSISRLASTGKITTAIKAVTIAGDGTSFLLPYQATVTGVDSIALRLWFHSVDGLVKEHRDFATIAYDYSPPAKLAGTDSLNFGDVIVHAYKDLNLTISNTGCSPLRVDSVRSSDATTFSLGTKRYPLLIGADSLVSIPVTFNPSRTGAAIESIEIGSSAGHTFITVEGNGIIHQIDAVSAEADGFAVFPNPASTTLILHGSKGQRYELHDLLGRIILQGSLDAASQSISIARIPAGVYLLNVGALVQRIVISHP